MFLAVTTRGIASLVPGYSLSPLRGVANIYSQLLRAWRWELAFSFAPVPYLISMKVIRHFDEAQARPSAPFPTSMNLSTLHVPRFSSAILRLTSQEI